MIWNLLSGENVVWQVDFFGMGYGSFVIYSGCIYVVMVVINVEIEFVFGDDGGLVIDFECEFFWCLYCFDQKIGEVLWMCEIFFGLFCILWYVKLSQVNVMFVIDGKMVVVFFGFEGMVVFSSDGEEFWCKDFGVFDFGFFGSLQVYWGYVSLLVIYENCVFVQVDCYVNLFIVVFDLVIGCEFWKVECQEKFVWVMLMIYVGDDCIQLFVIGGDFDCGFDLVIGEEFWCFFCDLQVKMLMFFVVDGFVIFVGGYCGCEFYVLLVNVEGFVRELIWIFDNGGFYMLMLVVYCDCIYFVCDIGIFNVFDLKMGEMLYCWCFDGIYLVLFFVSDGYILLMSEDGVVCMFLVELFFEEFGVVDMDEFCMVILVIVDQIFFVWCWLKVWVIVGGQFFLGMIYCSSVVCFVMMVLVVFVLVVMVVLFLFVEFKDSILEVVC